MTHNKEINEALRWEVDRKLKEAAEVEVRVMLDLTVSQPIYEAVKVAAGEMVLRAVVEELQR